MRVGFSSVAITINFFTISQIQLAQLSTIGYLRPAVTSLIAFFFWVSGNPGIAGWS